MAHMLEALDIHAGHRVLEIGLGTGYNAALLSQLAGRTGRVVSVDIDEMLVRNATRALTCGGYRVSTATADGQLGWPPEGPYDRIIVSASSATVPRPWWDQLAPDGILVVPLRLDAMQIIAVFCRTVEGFNTHGLIPGGFMPLRDGETGVEATASLTVRTHLLEGPAELLCSVIGPGVQVLSSSGRRKLARHLLDRPRRRRTPPHSAISAIWYVALATSPRRQIMLYINKPAVRFGLVDRRSGGCSVIVAQRSGELYTTTGIETYGPDAGGTVELAGQLSRWVGAGSPRIDRLGIEVRYSGATRHRAAAVGRTVRHPDHIIYFGFS